MISWTAKIDPALAAYCEDLARQAVPDTERIIREELEAFAVRLRGAWPVGDGKPEGHSRDKFAVRVVLTPSGVQGVLTNTSTYSAFIREKWPDKGNVARKLFFGPSKEVGLLIARRLAAEVGK